MCVAAEDDDQCGAAAYVQWCSEPDVSYFVIVGGVGGAYGTVDLTVRPIADHFESLYFATPPANDRPCTGPFVSCPPPQAAMLSSTDKCPSPAIVNLNFAVPSILSPAT